MILSQTSGAIDTVVSCSGVIYRFWVVQSQLLGAVMLMHIVFVKNILIVI